MQTKETFWFELVVAEFDVAKIRKKKILKQNHQSLWMLTHFLPLIRNFCLLSPQGYFMELLNRSAISLHATLSSAFETLYSQNAQVFSDLYADLRRYYRGSKVNLEEVLNEFWVRLLEKILYYTTKQSLIGITPISSNS